jgi:hypothetical protein
MKAARTALFVVIGMLLLCGIAIAVRGKGRRVVPTPEWVESQVPKEVGNFKTVLGPRADLADHCLTYKMDDQTYQILEPFGIVCRVMTNQDSPAGGPIETYDTVFIAGDDSHSFHQPEICFQTQNNEILDRQTDTVQTKSHGTVPIALLKIKNAQAGRGIQWAAFCFKGPYGYTASNGQMINDLLISEFLTQKPFTGAFYRFITENGGDDNATKDRLLTFIGKYMDAINQTSQGRF